MGLCMEIWDAGNPERSRTEQNGTGSSLCTYGRGRQICVGKLVLICQLINVKGTHFASCTSHEDGTSTQQTVQSHTKRIKHSSCLPGIFVGRRRPFAYKRGVSDVTTVSELSCGEWSYLWLTLEQEGNGIAFCTLHKYETSIATEHPLSC